MINAKSKRFYITFAITLLFMFGFQFLPPIGLITVEGMKVLGIFLGAIFAWVMGEVIWSSILACIMLTLYGFGGLTPNMSSFVGGQIPVMTVAAMLLGYALKECGIMTELALKITSSPLARKGPWVLAAFFFVATFVITLFTTASIAVIILIWTLFYEVCNKTGLKAHNPYVSYIIVGIAVIGNCTQIVMPYSAFSVVCMGVEKGFYPDLTINLFAHIGVNFTLVVLYIVGMVFVGKLLLGSRVKLDLPETEVYKMKLTKQMKFMIVYVAILVVMMLLPPLLPADNPIGVLFGTTLGTMGVMIVITLLMAFTYVDGESLLDIEKGLKNGVPWPLVFLVGSALLMSNFIVNPEYGILATFSAFVNPLFEGHSAFYVLVLSVILCLIMTNLINDIVTITVLFPICAPFFVAAGGNAEILGYLFTGAAVHGVFMPSGSMIGAAIHGNTEWLTSAEAFKYIGLQQLIVLVMLVAVGSVCFFIF